MSLKLNHINLFNLMNQAGRDFLIRLHTSLTQEQIDFFISKKSDLHINIFEKPTDDSLLLNLLSNTVTYIDDKNEIIFDSLVKMNNTSKIHDDKAIELIVPYRSLVFIKKLSSDLKIPTLVN